MSNTPGGPGNWSRFEVELLVDDHLRMLSAELEKKAYNKTTHRRALMAHLNERSEGSIERKHQNVSAVLIELGYPYIPGYKPLGNYQALLFEVTADRIANDLVLASIVRAAVEAPAAVLVAADLLDRWEDPPEPAAPSVYPPLRERSTIVRPPVNYLEREARNASLGRAGEEFVLKFERARLIQAGKATLAERVEHVALQGDGAGFDVRSFEANGKDRLIEVKTTAYGKQTPFFLSRNELAVSRERATSYRLYRLFRFREEPRLYGIQGALDQSCRLDPVQYSARVK